MLSSISLCCQPDGRRTAYPNRSKLQGMRSVFLDHIKSVAFSPDGATLASGSDDQTIKLWDIHTGEYQLTLKENIDFLSN